MLHSNKSFGSFPSLLFLCFLPLFFLLPFLCVSSSLKPDGVLFIVYPAYLFVFTALLSLSPLISSFLLLFYFSLSLIPYLCLTPYSILCHIAAPPSSLHPTLLTSFLFPLPPYWPFILSPLSPSHILTILPSHRPFLPSSDSFLFSFIFSSLPIFFPFLFWTLYYLFLASISVFAIRGYFVLGHSTMLLAPSSILIILRQQFSLFIEADYL